MKRVMPNIIEEVDVIATCTTDRAGDLNCALRYGADLLGRAIGHECAAMGIRPYGLSTGHGDFGGIIATAISGPTYRIMAAVAAREI
jgi:hypothetical protein